MSAPTSPSLPAGTPAVCPACGAPFVLPARGPCASCEVDLTHAVAAELLDLDRRWRELAVRRELLLAELEATRPTAVPPPPVWARAVTGEAAAGPALGASGADTAVRAPSRHLSVPTLLALAGVALLTTAAVVFTAVAWTTLDPLAQAAILFAATVVTAVSALALARREIPTAAAALGVLTMSFAAVDVVGLERTGAVPLGDFAVPLAAAVAAAVGWALARAQLRWVATAGAVAAIVAGATVTGAIAAATSPSLAGLALIGLGAALAVAATIPLWPTRPARFTAGAGAVAGVTGSGLTAAFALADGEVGWVAGLALVALPTVLLAVASRWVAPLLAPTALLVTAAVPAAAADLGAADLQVVAAVAVVVAVAVWLGARLPAERAGPLLVGCTPAVLAVAATSLLTLEPTLTRLATTVARDPSTAVDPWAATTVVLGAVALATVRAARARLEWLAVAVVVVVSAALPTTVAWPLLLVVAVAATSLRVGRPWAPPTARALTWDPLAPLATALVAIGWAAMTDWSLAVAAAVTTALAAVLVVALPGAGAASTDPVRTQVITGVGVAAGGLTAWTVAAAVGTGVEVAAGAALVVTFLAVLAVPRLRDEAPPVVGTIVAMGSTILLPASVATLRAAGVLLLIAAVGWLCLAVAGWRHARWLAAVAVSAGVTTLLSDAGVDVVEAYTVVPALTLGAAGVWWLVEDREVRTVPALAPALAVGLVPSLVVLTGDPEALLRTLGLVVLAGALAAVGVRGRWLAPTLAAAVTAVWVALTQLTIAVEVAPRWVTFAVVGILLVWLAATYERQQARARTLAQHLSTYR
jgi:hypothetical protein